MSKYKPIKDKQTARFVKMYDDGYGARNTTLTVSISEDLKNEVRALAQRKNETVSNMVNMILADHLTGGTNHLTGGTNHLTGGSTQLTGGNDLIKIHTTKTGRKQYMSKRPLEVRKANGDFECTYKENKELKRKYFENKDDYIIKEVIKNE